MITADRARELLDYNSETGEFYWRVQKGSARKGAKAGAAHPDGYRHISIDGRLYLCHRLAWLWEKGVWPMGDIDHIDGNRSNNAFLNLREASRSQNMQNQKRAHCRNGSGFLGVTFAKNIQAWRARIRLDGKLKHLGYFNSPEQAHEAYLNAKLDLHPFQTIASAK